MKRLKITVDGQVYEVVVEEVVSSGASAPPAPVAQSSPAPAAAPTSGDTVVPAPLSSVVVDVHVAVGQSVAAGDQVATVEAMKMNTVVSAPAAGKVLSIQVSKGDQVDEGQVILTLG